MTSRATLYLLFLRHTLPANESPRFKLWERKDHAVKLARCVTTSNDVVAYEDLRIKNMVNNHCLAKSINDASWYQFRVWLEYFGKVFKKITVAVPPQGTSQECSSCGTVVKKSLSTRTHVCQCGYILDRDHNAARTILSRGLSTTGHVGTFGAACWRTESFAPPNCLLDPISCLSLNTSVP